MIVAALLSAIQMALFATIFLLERRPMITFVRVRQVRGRRVPPPSFPLEAFQRINHVELALIVVMVLSPHSWPVAPGCSDRREKACTRPGRRPADTPVR